MTLTMRTVGFALVCVALAGLAHTVLAFAFFGRWAAGDIAMEMQLGAAGGLIDGSIDWDECAIAGLAQWNANLGGTGVSFTAVQGSTRTPTAVFPIFASRASELDPRACLCGVQFDRRADRASSSPFLTLPVELVTAGA
jgi:hypothetical protein